jgi:RNA polymerase sigma-70 factor (ECF subfamily)
VTPRHSSVDRTTPAAERATGDSDERLIREYARGDERAFGYLLERYRNRVVTLVRCRLGSRSLWVEDVAQDVFLQIHRSARRFEGRSAFKTWLFGVALNVCRDHIRRERRAGGTGAVEAEDDGTLALLPAESLDPLELLERTERDALIRSAIERLSAAHRTVLQLRDWEEMTYDEIAQVLAVPVGTVRSRLHNARAALAQALANGLRR